MRTPPIADVMMIADDPYIAATASSLLAKPGFYLPVIEGPRMGRPNHETEVILCNNTVALSRCTRIVFAGLEAAAEAALTPYLRGNPAISLRSRLDIEKLAKPEWISGKPLHWPKRAIAVGLLKALREHRQITFVDGADVQWSCSGKGDHLVVIEDNTEISQVIAANYAFSLGAGINIIPEVDEDVCENILAAFYGSNSDPEARQSEVLQSVQEKLRSLCKDVTFPKQGSVTFITNKLPFGFGFQEFPSTHLFRYPHLGAAVVNGLARERAPRRGMTISALVDPSPDANAPEIARARDLLSNRGSLVRTYRGRAATVRAFTELVEWVPYDFLLIATHCGDVDGHRWTYEYKDREGIDRTLVVDIALGIASTDEKDMLNVMTKQVFHSLDGVPWREKEGRIYVGHAVQDWLSLIQQEDELQPVKKENVDRVYGSAALKMSDHNYIALPQVLAAYGSPVVINSACVSWHELAGIFMYANASAYVGTLVEILPYEAEEVVIRVLGKHFDKYLPHALWSAQREVYGNNVRKPYVMTGIYTQKLHASQINAPDYLAARISQQYRVAKQRLRQGKSGTEFARRSLTEQIKFYEGEMRRLVERWPKTKMLLKPFLKAEGE